MGWGGGDGVGRVGRGGAYPVGLVCFLISLLLLFGFCGGLS